MAHPRYFFFWRFSFPPSFSSTPFTATGSDSLETAVFPGLRRGVGTVEFWDLADHFGFVAVEAE